MESRDVLKIHGALRRYCTSRVSLRSTLEVQYLLNLPCIFNTSLDSMLYLLNLLWQADDGKLTQDCMLQNVSPNIFSQCGKQLNIISTQGIRNRSIKYIVSDFD